MASILFFQGDNSFMVIIHTLGQFLGTDSSKGVEGVVTDYQHLPTLLSEGPTPVEGSGHSWLKTQTNPCK